MAAIREKVCFCPFGCLEADPELGTESDFDAQGRCKHLVGYRNLAPGKKLPVGTPIEKLEAVYRHVKDMQGEPAYTESFVDEVIQVEKTIKDEKTGEEVQVSIPETQRRVVKRPVLEHTGQMRCSCKHKEVVREGDLVITPEELQRHLTMTVVQDGVEKKRIPRLGLVARIYRKDGQTDVVTKPRDDDPRLDIQCRIEEATATLEDLKAKHREIDQRDSLSRPEVDEEAEGARQKAIEQKRWQTKRPVPA